MAAPPAVPDLSDRDDPLAQTLQRLHLTGVVYSQAELGAPWGLSVPAMPGCLMFHVFTRGEGWLVVDGQAPRLLRSGDFALVTRGEGHRLLGDPQAYGVPVFEIGREPLADWFERFRLDGGGAPAAAVCGVLRYDDAIARHLAASLPPTIVIDGLEAPERAWLHSSFRLLAAEAAQPRPGSEAVITRLGDILVVQAIRHWVETEGVQRSGWLRGLHDRQVGRALALMHRRLAEPWTLAGLAAEVGLSRTAFAGRFTRLVGEAPMAYLTRWRLGVAQARLREARVPLAQLAGEVGYESEAAFSRAFRREVGVTPGAFGRLQPGSGS